MQKHPKRYINVYSYTTFVHKFLRLIQYLDIGKCWEIPEKSRSEGVPYRFSLGTLWTKARGIFYLISNMDFI
jgi:hypothetical protein